MKYGGNVIGGILLLWFRKIMCGPAASSLRKYFHLCPNNLLYWETFRFAISKEMESFDLGRSTRDTGPHRFKQQWNTSTRQIYYQHWFDGDRSVPVMDRSRMKYRLASMIWKRIPIPITNVLGPVIMRRIM
ncbi:MAG: hypothetical protein A2161_07955 [Candidatus Schekmanbacteria bacterium RBG_13_48_7]|uniref:BioF2-like acetyltransferase domain-containing protein n=1 Tax=Candidatus Schekmanbacteria bacterium RBG_13_48_7 TaxID=1817878 RepID=A0A1F7S1Y4_9BACT|nr:MAG: hypothetical protein A2161_07955 [Candidatus Schekmanbacteria bacterium RBG_13_48_7]